VETDGKHRRPELVLGVTTLGLFLIMLNSSSVNVALPQVSAALHASTETADWFLLGFMVANTSAILIFGRLSDLLGRRRIYLIGMSVFVLVSIAAAFAPDAAVLIALRVLQGIAGATIITNSTALLADVFRADRLPWALGINISAAAVASTIGPSVGGLLVDSFGWRAVFLVNVPFGIASLLLGLRAIPVDRAMRGVRHVTDRFDVLGAILSVSGLSLVLIAVSLVQDSPGPIVAVAFAVGLVLLGLFVAVEVRSPSPLMDVRLVLSRARGYAYGAAFFNSFCRAGVVVAVVLEEQMIHGTSAAVAGLVVMGLAGGMALASPVAGHLTGRLSARTLSSAGGLITALAIGDLAIRLQRASLPETVAVLFVAGVGIGAFTAPNTSSIMGGIEQSRRAVANAIRSVLFNSAQVLGTSVTLLLVSASGITTYADQTTAPSTVTWFRIAYLVLALCAFVSTVASVARGGAWSVRAARPAPSAA
jgi:EmrB/QacA subfamily drug resistance transporter